MLSTLSLYCRYVIDTTSLYCCYTSATSSLHCRYHFASLSQHFSYIVATLSLQCRHVLCTMSLQYRYTMAILSLGCRYTVTTISLYCCYTVATMFVRCRYTVLTSWPRSRCLSIYITFQLSQLVPNFARTNINILKAKGALKHTELLLIIRMYSLQESNFGPAATCTWGKKTTRIQQKHATVLTLSSGIPLCCQD